MSRQDPNRYDPVHQLEQTVKDARLMYLRGFTEPVNRVKYLELEQIKEVVEKITDVSDISEKTRKRPLPNAIQLYTYLAVKYTRANEGRIMNSVNRDRTLFYHHYETAKDLLDVDKRFNKWYYESVKELENIKEYVR